MVKHAARANIRTTMAICLVLFIFGSFIHGSAQSAAPGLCTADVNSPCGFPVKGDPSQFSGRSLIHDSCIPEGSCPWIQGIDIWWPDQATSTKRPTDLISVMNGTVVTACAIDGAGNPVIAVRNTYYLAYYLHTDKCYVSVGQQVKIGDPLGLMGVQGRTSGITHVHFALKENSTGSSGLSLRLADLMPLLTGWGALSGVTSLPPPIEQPAVIKIDDLPYAQANQVLFFVAYTPTPVVPIAVATIEPTQSVVPTTTLVATSTPQPAGNKNNILWIAAVLLLLAAFFHSGEKKSPGRGRRQ